VRSSIIASAGTLVVHLTDNSQPIELNIGLDKVSYIISKARMFDADAEPLELEKALDTIDAENEDVLEESLEHPTGAELREAIDDLNEDEVIDLIALAWVGRGDFSRGEWEEARALAEERHQEHSADYLMGMPTLGDYLEEGLGVLGYSTEEP
jgi:hypothetical protein